MVLSTGLAGGVSVSSGGSMVTGGVEGFSIGATVVMMVVSLGNGIILPLGSLRRGGSVDSSTSSS